MLSILDMLFIKSCFDVKDCNDSILHYEVMNDKKKGNELKQKKNVTKKRTRTIAKKDDFWILCKTFTSYDGDYGWADKE